MIDIVIEARNAALSKSVMVKRILPFRLKRMVGPFIFLDHAGPIKKLPSDPSSLDVLPHPHIGLSTVSYLFGGSVTHRDSLGVEQIIRPGEVNWMRAGSGIAHSERFEDPEVLTGGDLEMIQTWLLFLKKMKNQILHLIIIPRISCLFLQTKVYGCVLLQEVLTV
jgi:redox-sensitive bicupin YhaK (pirin superfamily)